MSVTGDAHFEDARPRVLQLRAVDRAAFFKCLVQRVGEEFDGRRAQDGAVVAVEQVSADAAADERPPVVVLKLLGLDGGAEVLGVRSDASTRLVDGERADVGYDSAEGVEESLLVEPVPSGYRARDG